MVDISNPVFAAKNSVRSFVWLKFFG